MKGLLNIIQENITNTERQYRQFIGILYSYGLDETEIKNITVKETSKHNYIVYNKDKKVCILSNNIINPNVFAEYKIKFEQ